MGAGGLLEQGLRKEGRKVTMNVCGFRSLLVVPGPFEKYRKSPINVCLRTGDQSIHSWAPVPSQLNVASEGVDYSVLARDAVGSEGPWNCPPHQSWNQSWARRKPHRVCEAFAKPISSSFF